MRRSLLLLLAHAAIASALRVASRGVSRLPAPSDHDRVVQEWSVSASNPGEYLPLQSLVVNTGHQVYVVNEPLSNTEDEDALATVRVVGDRARLVSALVDVSASENELSVHAAVSSSSVNAEGYARTEIVIHREASIFSVRVGGSGDVVVADGVLGGGDGSARIKLTTSGSGDLYLTPNQTLHGVGLDIVSSGSGGITVPAGAVKVSDSLTLRSSGSGGISIDATSFTATSVSLQTQASGPLTISSSRFSVVTLNIHTSGSGDVRVKPDAVSAGKSAANCHFESSGSGNVDASGIPCISAMVQSSGAGGMTVHVKISLTYKVSGSGKVYYVGGSPMSIASLNGRRGHSIQEGSTTAPSSPSWLKELKVPPQEATHFLFGAGNQPGDDDDGLESDSSIPGTVVSTLQPTTTAPPVPIVLPTETPLAKTTQPRVETEAPITEEPSVATTSPPVVTTSPPAPVLVETASPLTEPPTVLPLRETSVPVAATSKTADDIDSAAPIAKEVESSTDGGVEAQVDSHRVLIAGLAVAIIAVFVAKRIFAWCGRRSRRGENAPLLSTEAPVYI